MHFSEISFSSNLMTMKFKLFVLCANMVGPCGIIKQANSLPDSNFEKLAAMRELYKSYGYGYYSSYSTMNSSAFTSFRPFISSSPFFSFLITSLIFLLSTKTYKKTNDLIYVKLISLN